MTGSKQPSHHHLRETISGMIKESDLGIDHFILCPLNKHNYHLKIVHRNGYVWRMQFKMHEWAKALNLLSSYLEPI